jgi:2-oxo-4-hydroxy-4-carboxy--5-ureidoimidazoline (OHCU) decarboxylase
MIDIISNHKDDQQALSGKGDEETLYSDHIESEMDNFDNMALPEDKEFKKNKMSTRDYENQFNMPLSPNGEPLKVNAYKPKTIQAFKKNIDSSDEEEHDTDVNL